MTAYRIGTFEKPDEHPSIRGMDPQCATQQPFQVLNRLIVIHCGWCVVRVSRQRASNVRGS
jgi:hypothetical protein